jgi:NADH dehydrogenase/NADH:ubiquinone oxidoreductase subunit G
MEEISLTIDSRTVKAVAGQTILEIVLENGIGIPYLCYHPRVSKRGACGMCLVRINDKMLKASCTELAIDSMEVITENEVIVRHRKWLLELLLSKGDHKTAFTAMRTGRANCRRSWSVTECFLFCEMHQ